MQNQIVADDKLTENVLTGAGIFIGGVIISLWKYIRRRFRRKPAVDPQRLEYENEESAQMFYESTLIRKMPQRVRIAEQSSGSEYFAGLVGRLRQSNILSKRLVIDMSETIECNDPAAMAIAALCRDIAEHNVLKLEFIMPRKKTKGNKLLRQVVMNSAKITPASISFS